MLTTTFTPREIMKVVVKNYTRDIEANLSKHLNNYAIVIKVVAGEEYIEIIKEVLHNHYDLLIKTARSLGGTKAMLSGSIAMHLLQKCPCPLLLLEPGCRQPFEQIMVVVDVVLEQNKEIDASVLAIKPAGFVSSVQVDDK